MNELTYLWLDFETTDLDPAGCAVLEVAVVGTAADPRDELFSFQSLVEVDAYGLDRLVQMPEVVRDMHEGTGLSAELVAGKGTLPTLAAVEEKIVDLILGFTSRPITLAGSGVSHFDSLVIRAQMPELAGRLTYFCNDIGNARRFYRQVTGTDVVTPQETIAHRAMADVRDGLREAAAFADLYRHAAPVLHA